jgi:branched-chain amino acid transport system permease protein
MVEARRLPPQSADAGKLMDAQLLLAGVIFGLSIGSVFFLMAIGLSLCFGLMRVISLDQLLYYSIGAYITYTVSVAAGSVWLGVVAGMGVAGVTAFAVERFIFRRIYDRDVAFSMITTFGVLIGGVGVIKAIWGLVPRPVAMPVGDQVDVVGTHVPAYRLIVVVIAVLVYIGIWLFLNRTIVGKAIRAGIEDVDHVEGLGIDVYRLFTITFIIAGTLSGLAGGLHAPLIMVDPSMGLEVIALVFMVVIIGGLGSIKGTAVSALLVGQVMSLGSLIYAPLAQMAPFAIMLLILLIKPTGLYGSPMLKR